MSTIEQEAGCNFEISQEAARLIAIAIAPQIGPYIEQNWEKYEAWLQAKREKEPTYAHRL